MRKLALLFVLLMLLTCFTACGEEVTGDGAETPAASEEVTDSQEDTDNELDTDDSSESEEGTEEAETKENWTYRY